MRTLRLRLYDGRAGRPAVETVLRAWVEAVGEVDDDYANPWPSAPPSPTADRRRDLLGRAEAYA